MVVLIGRLPVVKVTVTGQSLALGSEVRLMPSPQWIGSSCGVL
jgi:hypothetical protein